MSKSCRRSESLAHQPDNDDKASRDVSGITIFKIKNSQNIVSNDL